MTRETHVRTGIAGECCTEKKIINIEDAYQDSRFNPALDKASGSLRTCFSFGSSFWTIRFLERLYEEIEAKLGCL